MCWTGDSFAPGASNRLQKEIKQLNRLQPGAIHWRVGSVDLYDAGVVLPSGDVVQLELRLLARERHERNTKMQRLNAMSMARIGQPRKFWSSVRGRGEPSVRPSEDQDTDDTMPPPTSSEDEGVRRSGLLLLSSGSGFNGSPVGCDQLESQHYNQFVSQLKSPTTHQHRVKNPKCVRAMIWRAVILSRTHVHHPVLCRLHLNYLYPAFNTEKI